MLVILMLLVGLMLLLAGGTSLVRGASAIANHYGVSPLIVGLTVVAFGTSSPELVVNIIGSLRGETALAFGNVTGSNLANIGLVLSVAAMVSPITIEGQIVRRELPLLLLGTTILLIMALDKPLVGLDPVLTRSDALILLLIFGIFVYLTVSDFLFKRQDPLMLNILHMEERLPTPAAVGVARDWIFVVAGIICLTIGGQLTVVNGAQLATFLGLPPVVVGLVIVAVGTSLPEFATSIIAALNKEPDLCVGNVVGSNIFNALVVLPISALVHPLPIPGGGLVDVAMTLVLAAAIILIFFVGRAHMNRGVGLAVLCCYLGYMIMRTTYFPSGWSTAL
jgi:cation:H+ antiporter